MMRRRRKQSMIILVSLQINTNFILYIKHVLT